MTYEEIIQKAGKQIEPKVSYYNDNNELVYIDRDEIISIKYAFNSNIIGSLMKTMEVELKSELPNKEIRIQNIATFEEYTQTKDFGIYKLKEEPTYNADTKTYTHKLCDGMLDLMKDYVPITITYPTTVFQYFNAFIIQNGYTTDIVSLPNGDKIIQHDIYQGINYTNRDVLDDIGQATATLFKENNKVIQKATFGTESKIIDDDILKNQNISMGQHFGPINVIVLSRSGDSDNIYYPSILPNNPKEFKISDNQLMNDNNRVQYLQEIYNKLNGLNFDIFDCSLVGYGGFEPLDKVQIQTYEGDVLKTYDSYVFNNEITITKGYDESIYTSMPNETETEYKYADITDKRINQTYLIVDKQNGIIENVVTNVNEQNNKISQITQTVNELNSKIQDIADITISGESNFATFTLENINESEPIQIKVKPINDNISYLYPSSGLYPSNNLYPKVRIIRFHNNTTNQNVDYVLPDNLLIYDSTHYDEFYLDYDSQTCQITKRCKYNSDGSVSLLDTERVDDYPYPSILLEDGDYTLTLLGYEYGYLFVRLMTKNIYTSQFYTKAETNSRINQKANEITTGVDLKLSNYSTTTEVNTAINQKITDNNNAYVDIEVAKKVNNTDYTKAKIVAKINDNTSQAQISADVIDLDANDILNIISGNELNLTSKNIAIKSTNFNVDKDGNTTCKNLTATGGKIGTWTINNQGLASTGGYFIKNITLTSQGQTIKLGLTNIYTMSDIIICSLILRGVANVGSPDTAEFKHYDVNGDGVIDSKDLLLLRQMMLQ